MTYSLICFASVDPAQAVTLFMWKCCYDVLREWWSFYRSPAANSFHPPNLRWLMPRLLFFFPHGLVPPCVISERRVCFWFNFQITCMWEHCWTSHVSLKIQLAYRFKGETMWAHCLGYYMVIHLGGMHPLGSLCGSRLVCILIWMPQPELYFNMTAKSIPPVFFMSSHLKRNHYVTDAANKVFWFPTAQINTCFSFQTNGHGSEAVYQERLSRLESDKECLILQVCLHCGHKTAAQLLLNWQLSGIVSGCVWVITTDREDVFTVSFIDLLCLSVSEQDILKRKKKKFDRKILLLKKDR